MSSLCLSNGVAVLDLHWTESTAALAESLTDFLHPWFVPICLTRQADLTVRLAPPTQFSSARRTACVESFMLRRSSAAIFNLEVRRGVSTEGLRLAWDEQRQVGYAIDPATASVDFYGFKEDAFIHLIELVRYYGLLIEQAKGTVILHSAAVRRRDCDEVVAIAGAKGAGKTTTMLSMLASGEFVYFSGDKLLLDQRDGLLRVRGWPDYPHVGIGTLRNHVELAERLGVGFCADDGTPLPDAHKILLKPTSFLAEIGKPQQGCGRLIRMVLPRINEPAVADQLAVEQDDKRAVSLADMFEWPHQFVTGTWHGLPLVGRAYTAEVSDGLMEALRQLPWTYRFAASKAAAIQVEASQ